MSGRRRRAWLQAQPAYIERRQQRLDRAEVRRLIGETDDGPRPDEPDWSLIDALGLDEDMMGGTASFADAADVDAIEWEPLKANPAQSRFRSAVHSGEFDLLLAAGTISSSKTFGMALIGLDLCLEYPETWGMVVRATYKQLVDNTIPDFLAVIPPHRIRKFNRSSLTIVLDNESIIQFRISNEKADKTFSWLKGKKLDWALVDECDGMSLPFVGMLRSRVGVQHRRRRRYEKTCPPITLLTCNPNNAWPKDIRSKAIHTPASLRAERTYYQQFTIEDNKENIKPEQIAKWKRDFTPPMYKRFVLGSWDAMSEREQLFLYEYLDKCAALVPPPADPDAPKWPYFLGVDPARYGTDRATFLIMHGPNIHSVSYMNQSSTHEVGAHVLKLMSEYEITPDHVTIDADGLGSGVVDWLAERRVYVNEYHGAGAVDLEGVNFSVNFGNKRAQVFWQAMQWMRDGKIGGLNPQVLGWAGALDGTGDPILLHDVLSQDLAAIHYLFAKGTKAVYIEDKEEIRKRLGRSIDFADVLVLAFYSMFRDANQVGLEVIY